VVEVLAVWAEVYVVEANVEVVWVDGVFLVTLTLLIRQCFAVKPMLLICHHSKEAQLVGYIQGLFSLYP